MIMKKGFFALAVCLIAGFAMATGSVTAAQKEPINAVYIPLADHFRHLNVDKPGLKQIMDLAPEGGILKKPIDIDAFADTGFYTEITEKVDD